MRLSKNGCLLAITILMSFSSLMTVEAQTQGTSADQYVASGQQLLKANNYTQAAQYFFAAVKVDPNNASAYQGLGNCYYMAGRKSDALSFYQKSLSIQPGNTQLAQFVQNLQGQLNLTTGAASANPEANSYTNPAFGAPASPAANADTNPAFGAPMGSASSPTGSMGMTADPLTQGTALFQQKQYTAAIPYFQSAAQQNPNDYRAFYYMGYAYYMTGNAKMAALYFAVANMKQPNASIQAYADQTKNQLSPDDQQWVSTQLSQYNSPGGAAANSSDNAVAFGFNFLGGASYLLSNPSQIVNGVLNAQANGSNISLVNGTAPNILANIGIEPYLQLGQSFELDFGASYIPVANLAYTWIDTDLGKGYQDSFNSSVVVINVGLKIMLGDSNVKGYLALGGDIAPVSTTFNKLLTDGNGTLTAAPADPSSGNYSSVAVGGYARLGVDFYLAKGLALGPFLGVQVLTATNFQNGSNTLEVNNANGDVGAANSPAFLGVTNMSPLTLDYTNVSLGMNLKFSL